MRFIDLLARLAGLDEHALEGRVPFSILRPVLRSAERSGIDARYALLFRTLERENEMVVRARTTYRGGEAQRILGLAQVAFGDLRGVLAGVTDAQLDRAPRQGEWSARETLKHTIGVERSYRANALQSIRRGPDEPLTLPLEARPQPDPADIAGDGSYIAARLATRRAETDAELGGTTDEELARPSQWVDMDCDVRFRLHRFASHLVEHTVQCERALEAAGLAFGDARRTVRRISVARAMHERITPPDELERLDAEHEQRVAGGVMA
jgi:hypothetical protein